MLIAMLYLMFPWLALSVKDAPTPSPSMRGANGVVVISYEAKDKIVATGGDVTHSGPYTVHTFKKVGEHDFTVNSAGSRDGSVFYLYVEGGEAAYGNHGGKSGSCGYGRARMSTGTYTVAVGGGGAATVVTK